MTEVVDSRSVVFTISNEDLSNTSPESNEDPHSRQSPTTINGERPAEHRRPSFDDKLPHADYYRNETDVARTGKIRKRPTLLELHTYDTQVVCEQ